MLEAFKLDSDSTMPASLEVILTFEERQKSRYKTTTTSNQAIGWFIERGTVLKDGDVLACQSGERIRVIAAPEPTSQIDCSTPLALTRAAYHLGNRHVPLQIGEGFLRYQHDHVLDDMVIGLGLTVSYGQRPFHPENGAYHGSHAHHHEHS